MVPKPNPVAKKSRRIKGKAVSKAGQLINSRERASKSNKRRPTRDLSAFDLLRAAHQLDEWAYVRAQEQPDKIPELIEISEITRRFQRMFVMAHYIWRALQTSPRRTVSGRKSAIERMGKRVPRSTLYKFLNTDLGLNDESQMDGFRCAHTMEQVIAACPPLKELAAEVEICFEEHQPEIQKLQIGEQDQTAFETSNALA